MSQESGEKIPPKKRKVIGFAMTGSFCTHQSIRKIVKELTGEYHIIPIFSENVSQMDTRFGTAEENKRMIEEITGEKIITTIQGAETIGPGDFLDAMVIAPCTGNTLAKLAHGIVDTTVLMAAKAHLRNQKPLILSISTNDALGLNFQNIAVLLNQKNIYFVPFGQDNFKSKPNSIVANAEMISETLQMAFVGRQIQPLILGPRPL